MRPLPNFNFAEIKNFPAALAEIEVQLNNLASIVEECDDTFSEADRTQLVANILWLKRFYETAERCVLND